MGKVRGLPLSSVVLDATAISIASDDQSEVRAALRRWEEDGVDLFVAAATLTEVASQLPRPVAVLTADYDDITALADPDVMVLDIAA